MTGNPFIDLIIYLLLVAGVLWALDYALQRMVPDPTPRRIAILIVGIILLIVAFQLSGILPLMGGV